MQTAERQVVSPAFKNPAMTTSENSSRTTAANLSALAGWLDGGTVVRFELSGAS